MVGPEKKHILLVTCKQPSSNPRLVKEAMSLLQAGYRVTVVYNFWNKWADEADVLIKKQHDGINWIKVAEGPDKEPLNYLLSRLRYKYYKLMAAMFPNSNYFQTNALCQFYPELKKNTVKVKADLYIGHTFPALPVTAAAAKKNKAAYAFDAEDFHSGQEDNSNENTRAKLMEDLFFDDAVYISAASPLIAAEYKKQHPQKDFSVINNVFSRKQQPAFSNIGSKDLKLFWFSQTIGLRRGLHDIIAAINRINDFKICLTIMGDATENVKENLTSLLTGINHHIVFLPPANEQELINIAAGHHIGLALEPGFSVNNNIALSNKLFTYLLAGNAVIFSDTPAQQQFYNNYAQEAGWLYHAGDAAALESVLRKASEDKEELNRKRKAAWQLAAQQFNWEKEEEIFLQLIKKTA